MASNFLLQSSFLDPRFKNLLIPEDVALIKASLKKLNDIDPADATDTVHVKKEKEQPVPTTKQKSGMDELFKFLNSNSCGAINN